MNRRQASLAVFLLIICVIAPFDFAFAADKQKLSLPPQIEKLLALPEDQIDYGVAAMTFTNVLYPNIIVGSYSSEIDHIADEVRAHLGHTASYNQMIAAMHTVIFEEEGFQYDFNDTTWQKTYDYFLPGILNSKKGTCVTLPLLYLAVAQRIGMPVYLAESPQHTFVRLVDDSGAQVSIEVTSGAYTKRDFLYVDESHISQAAIDSGVYMRTLTRREFLGNLLAYNAHELSKDHMYDMAEVYLKRAEQINPRSPFTLISLEYLYLNKMYQTTIAGDPVFMAWADGYDKAGQYFAEAYHYNQRMIELGIDESDYGEQAMSPRIDKQPVPEIPLFPSIKWKIPYVETALSN